MGKKENLVTAVVFLTLLFGFGGAFALVKDRAFSENENRYLAQMPKLSGQKALSGEFMKDMDEYVSDQFVFRDFFMGAASEYRRLLGMKDMEGVYLADDGYLIPKTESRDVDFELVQKNISYVSRFLEGCGAVERERKVFLVVPTSALVLKEKLPAYAPEFDQEGLIADIADHMTGGVTLDVTETLRSMERQSYYRTDHHWTTQGAFEAYRAYAALYGKNPVSTDWGFETVRTDFRGSLYSKVLLPDAPYDDIVLAKERDGVAVLCDNKPGALYDYEALTRKDKYNVFLGGNYGRVEIEGRGEGTLLLIKDSFANSFVPFLTEDYERIIMLDMRYYMGSVRTLVGNEGVTDILVLYNTANFISDKNIIKLGL